MTEYMIRRTDTGDFWFAGNPFLPGREHWTNQAAGTRYDAMSLAIMDSMRWHGRVGFEVEVVPVESTDCGRDFHAIAAEIAAEERRLEADEALTNRRRRTGRRITTRPTAKPHGEST